MMVGKCVVMTMLGHSNSKTTHLTGGKTVALVDSGTGTTSTSTSNSKSPSPARRRGWFEPYAGSMQVCRRRTRQSVIQALAQCGEQLCLSIYRHRRQLQQLVGTIGSSLSRRAKCTNESIRCRER